MTTSRPALPRRTLGLATIPALLLGLAACGDDDEDSASGDFCEQAEAREETMDSISEPTNEQRDDAMEAFRAMDPPAEIEDEWTTVMSALDAFTADNPDPAAMAELMTDEMQAAGDRVDEYLTEECGL